MPPAVLYVDDDRPNLDMFRRLFDDELCIVTAESGPEALALMATEEVGVLVSDHRMSPMTGVELLEQVEAKWPDITRILLSAYSDRELLMAAIQRGHVHDYVLKPWDAKDMSLRLAKALER